MNTMKNSMWMKAVVKVAIVPIILMQAVPAGFSSAVPVNLEEAQKIAETSVETKTTEAQGEAPIPRAHEDFFNASPLVPADKTQNGQSGKVAPADSSASQSTNVEIVTTNPVPKPDIIPGTEVTSDPIPDKDSETPQSKEVKATITNDLMKNFGFTKEMLEDYLKRGLVTITVDLKNLTATVKIDPSVKLPSGKVFLADPMGEGKLPDLISYRLQSNNHIMFCPYGSDCGPSYSLVSGHFRIGFNSYDLDYHGAEGYHDNRLRSVKVRDITFPAQFCAINDCPEPGLVKTIVYTYAKDGSVSARITYAQAGADGVSVRTVDAGQRADGQYFIRQVKDYDKAGRLIATSTFNYADFPAYCVPGSECPSPNPVLVSITRTDKDGKLLSTIRFDQLGELPPFHNRIDNMAFEPAFLRKSATIVFPDGRSEAIFYSSFENLLNQALKLEAEPSPEVKAVMATIQADLIKSFGFTKEMLADYLKKGLVSITVDLKNLTASVKIDPSVKLPEGTVFLADPLGDGKLPKEIFYKLEPGPFPAAPCLVNPDGSSNCPPAPAPHLASGQFVIGSNEYELDYLGNTDDVIRMGGDNRLKSVKVISLTRPAQFCAINDCPKGGLVKTIVYTYSKDGSVSAEITYAQAGADGVSVRTVDAGQRADGQYFIRQVKDYDKAGRLIATSTFNYADVSIKTPCEGSVCLSPNPVLVSITRTDKAGKLLSTISFNQVSETLPSSPRPDFLGKRATIVFPDGRSEAIVYSSFENLLNQALKLEAEPSPAVKAVIKTIQGDLMKSFGFSDETLKGLIAKGLIQIKVDLKSLTATVIFGEGVQMPKGAFLANPLGSGELPKQINYQLGQSLYIDPNYACSIQKCPTPQPTYYYLISGQFDLSDGQWVEISYLPEGQLIRSGDNLIHSVKIYKDNPLFRCAGKHCGSILQQEISYQYSKDASGQDTITGRIVYSAVSQEGVAVRNINLLRMADGLFHIQSVTDMDKNGKVIAKSTFKYLTTVADCAINAQGSNCKNLIASVILDHIDRTGGDGKLLSTIRNIQGYSGELVLPDGKTLTLNFNDYNKLFEQVLKIEQENLVPLEVQAYVDELKNKIGEGLKISVVKQMDGTYLVTVLDAKVYVTTPTAGLHQLSFVLDATAHLQANSLEAVYYGANEEDIKVDATLLFEGLHQLAQTPEDQDLRALGKMTRLSVTSLDANKAIYFTLDGKNYKTYRDADGKVMLQEANQSPLERIVTDEIKRQLMEFYGYQGEVHLEGWGEFPIEPPLAGTRIYFKASIQGTNWTVWGLVSGDHELRYVGLATRTDAEEAVKLIVEALAQYISNGENPTLFTTVQNDIEKRQGTNLISEELRFSLLRGILKVKDTIANPDDYRSISQLMAGIFRSISFSDLKIKYLLDDITGRWVLTNRQSRDEIEKAAAYSALYSILNDRAYLLKGQERSSDNTLALAKELVTFIVSQDRSRHMGFSELFHVVASHYLRFRETVYDAINWKRDPAAVFQILERWFLSQPFQEKSSFALLQVTKELADLQVQLEDPLKAGRVREIEEALTEELLKRLFYNPEERTSSDLVLQQIFRVDHPDTVENMGLFNRLGEEIRDGMVRFLLSVVKDSSLEFERRHGISFLLAINEEGNISDGLREQIRDFLVQQLDQYTKELMSELENGVGIDELGRRLKVAIRIAKAYEQKDKMIPLLEKWIVRFGGDGSAPPESEAQFRVRKNLILALWKDHGVFLVDPLGVLSRRTGLMERFDQFYQALGAKISHAHHMLVIQQWGYVTAKAADDSVVLRLPPPPANPEQDEQLNSILYILAHEIGHNLHRQFTVETLYRWKSLYESSETTPSDNDFISWYASTEQSEDAGECVGNWFGSNFYFLDSALRSANVKDRLLLMERYLFWADYFASKEGGRESYSMYATAAGDDENRYLKLQATDQMTITARDEQGRIVVMNDGKNRYLFQYDGARLKTVRVENLG